MPKWI